jgi:hypothetical protein
MLGTMHEETRKKYRGLAKKRDLGYPLASIRAFCIECMGGQLSAIAGCTAPECPLLLLRFGKRISAVSDRDETCEEPAPESGLEPQEPAPNGSEVP